MLLESWRLAKALEGAGVSVASRSSEIATPGKAAGPCIRVCIAKDLSISILPVTDGQRECLWSFRQGNFHFWPVIRPSNPLCINDAKRALALAAEARKVKSKDKRTEMLNEVYAIELPNADPDISVIRSSEMSERSHYKSTRTLIPDPLRKLRHRLARLNRKPGKLEEALRQVANNPELHPALFALYFGKLVNADVKSTGQIAFDLMEETIYTSPNRAYTERRLNAALVQNEEDNKVAPSDVFCAFAGTAQPRHVGKFPNPSIPVVAMSGIAMFSMFHDAPTNTRYGHTDDGIVSIGKRTVLLAQDSIKHATSGEMEGQLWKKFLNGKSKGKREDSDLLIACAMNANIAVVPGFGEFSPDQAYEDSTRPVLEALDGVIKLTPDAEILLILLRQISNAQVQSVYCRTPKAATVLEAGRRWMRVQQSRPRLFTDPADDVKKRRIVSPETCVRLLGKFWGGRPPKPTRLNGPSGGEVIDFFLSTGAVRSSTAKDLLKVALLRTESLLIYVGVEARKSPVDADGPLVMEADKAAFFITLLLEAMDINMESTTRSSAYQLGLLLGLVDTLHSAYSRVIRNEEEPRSLGGSQLLGKAADNPASALAELCERIRPWYDWADNVRPKPRTVVPAEAEPDDIAVLRAKKALSRMASIAPHLEQSISEDRLDDVGKAKLLLGFLSRDSEADQYRDSIVA
ncbi:MAG: hypothetical protein ACLQVD_00015 [Capsulimonadaceae bacterium]